MTQFFKENDAEEQKMFESALPALVQAEADRDEFYDNAYDNRPFLLALYDGNKVPFSLKVIRDSFPEFYQAYAPFFPFAGSFESIIAVLKGLFGADSEILFDVPAPGKLAIDVFSTSEILDNFIFREPGDSDLMIDSDGDEIVFRSLGGINTEHELMLICSEIVLAGIWLELSLNFFEKFFFVAENSGGDLEQIVDHLGNELIFIEVGA